MHYHGRVGESQTCICNCKTRIKLLVRPFCHVCMYSMVCEPLLQSPLVFNADRMDTTPPWLLFFALCESSLVRIWTMFLMSLDCLSCVQTLFGRSQPLWDMRCNSRGCLNHFRVETLIFWVLGHCIPHQLWHSYLVTLADHAHGSWQLHPFL